MSRAYWQPVMQLYADAYSTGTPAVRTGTANEEKAAVLACAVIPQRRMLSVHTSMHLGKRLMLRPREDSRGRSHLLSDWGIC